MNNLKYIFLTIILFANLFVFSQSKLKRAERDKVVLNLKSKLSKEFNSKNLILGNPIFIRVIKQADNYKYGVLEMWVKGNNVDTFSLFKKYKICTYSGGLGTKNRQGDCKTPEGFYYVNASRINQYSRFHRAFNIGYPNTYDKAHHYTGDYIMIHGACCSIGCIAMTDTYIEEIWTIGISALSKGQNFFRVHIFPFYMTENNINKYKGDKNFDFWQNLKQGYDSFENNKYPPNVEVNNLKYIFNN